MAMTLRLTQDETEALEQIKQRLGSSTATAALKQMIMDYENLQDRESRLSIRSSKALQEIQSLKLDITNFVAAFDKLSKSVKN